MAKVYATNVTSNPLLIPVRLPGGRNFAIGFAVGQEVELTLTLNESEVAFSAEIAYALAQGYITKRSTSDVQIYTNITRPDASLYTVGFAIWNSDDNAYNYSDGVVWRDAAGVST